MKKLVPLIFLLGIHFSHSLAQGWNWAHASSSSYDEEITDMASYPGSDYFYIAGTFAGSITLGGTGLKANRSGLIARDIFITKYHDSAIRFGQNR